MQKYDNAIERLLRGENTQDLQLGIRGNEDFECKVSWISINAGLIENGEKKIFCIIRDISGTKTDELRKYIEAQKKKDRLKQNISNIRNKIQKMTGDKPNA